MPAYREARPLRLGNLERLELVAALLDVLASPVPGLWGQRHDAVIFEPDELLAVQVDDGDDILDGPGVAVVMRLGANPAEARHQPLAFILGGLVAVVAGRPRVDHDQADVVDAPLFHRLAEDGRLLDRLFALAELVEHDRRLDALGQGLVPVNRARAEVDDRLVSTAGRAVEQDHERRAW